MGAFAGRLGISGGSDWNVVDQAHAVQPCGGQHTARSMGVVGGHQRLCIPQLDVFDTLEAYRAKVDAWVNDDRLENFGKFHEEGAGHVALVQPPPSGQPLSPTIRPLGPGPLPPLQPPGLAPGGVTTIARLMD